MADTPTSPVVHVRRACADDAELLVTLNGHVQAVHAALLPALFKPAGHSTLTPSDVHALLAMPETLALVASIDDQPAGYAYAEVRRRPENRYVYANDEVYLHHISVAPQARRQGVGTALLDAIRQAAAEHGIIRVALDVWTINDTARAFFRSHGFEPYNERLAWSDVISRRG